MNGYRKSCWYDSRSPSVWRRGISLLEVLIAIMVLSIGLLGLASLIPVGKFEVAQAMIVDRAATLGRLTARDIPIRGILRPDILLVLSPSSPGSQTPSYYSNLMPPNTQSVLPELSNAGGSPLIFLPLCIDPLMIGHPYNLSLPSSPHALFPYVTSNVPSMPGAPPIARCTILPYPNYPAPLAMDYRQAERIFRSADDLAFVLPLVDSQRPDQVFQYQLSPVLPVQRQYQGDFSWLVTVSPALSDFLVLGPNPGQQVQNVVFQGVQVPRTFHASIVVFNKRTPIMDTSLNINAAVPSERTVYADILGSGFGGGDMVLRVKGLSQAQATNMLAVKAQQWIALFGAMATPPNGGDLVPNRVVMEWYRIVKVTDQVEDLLGDGSNWGRRVTLSGPDWLVVNPINTTQIMFTDVDSTSLPGSGSVTTVYAGLFEGVIAVYDRAVILDGFSLWQ